MKCGFDKCKKLWEQDVYNSRDFVLGSQLSFWGNSQKFIQISFPFMTS